MQHYYSTNEMENKLAGEGYSTANGTWVTGEKIIFGLITIPAGTRAKPHSHPNEQITLLERGKLRFVVDGEENLVQGGAAVQIPPNAPHVVEALEDSVAVDLFSPVREDWLRGDDSYLRR